MTDHTDLVRRLRHGGDNEAATFGLLDDAVDAIDQLQAQLAVAEADADRLAGRVANIPSSWRTVVDAEALRLHDEAVAKRSIR